MRPGSRNAALAKRQADQRVLARLARQAEATTLAAALGGPNGPALRDLQRFLREMEIGDGRALVAHVEASALRRADDRLRLMVVRLIGKRIGDLRERAGLARDDDPMPDQPRSAGQWCRDLLRERLP